METECGTALMDWLGPLLAAPFVGSLLGVLIVRLPVGRPVAVARSACEGCGHVLAARDLVPLLSFAALRGRCRFCGAPISWFHPAIEVAAVVVALWAIIAETYGFCGRGAIWIDRIRIDRIWTDCALGWTLLALAWTDYRHMRLPDALTLPLIVAGLAVTAATAPDAAADHAAAAAAGYGAFRLIALGYARLRGREGLGGGDAKLLAAAGAWLGLSALPNVVLAAALLGIALVLAKAVRGQAVAATTAIPFGPCLAVSIWMAWLYFQDALP